MKALDKEYAVLVLCAFCNGEVVTDKARWPQARQLALLKKHNPDGYDLTAFNTLIGRGMNRITESDVNQYQGEFK